MSPKIVILLPSELFWRLVGILVHASDVVQLPLVDIRARSFLWNVSASSHMTSVTQRNILDPMGVVGDCSYTPHNNHLVG